LRTHTLISLGAALFTVASLYGFGVTADASRIASGVVAGIGFLGAGSIIRGEEGIVAGLTTAATIWSVAAVGLAAGSGLYLLAAVSAGLILLILCLPHFIQ
jgi:putative Mg2+ transporter-C (MgtC) family protein